MFQAYVVPYGSQLLCGLERSLQKNGAGSDPIGIPITWIIMIFPIKKKNNYVKEILLLPLSNDLVKTKWYSLFLDYHDAQLCLLIIM